MRKITYSDLAKISDSIIHGYCVEDARIKRGDESDIENYGIILARNANGLYVTWQFHFEDEKISVYWGHYTLDREKAWRDFNERDMVAEPNVYKVTITETSEMAVNIKAKTREEAIQTVSDKWRNSEYVLDADNFVGAEFSAEETDEVEDED